MTEALAQAIPVGVQHCSKPRFVWAVVQEKKSLLQWVVPPARHGCSQSAWDCMGCRSGVLGYLSVREGLCSVCLV